MYITYIDIICNISLEIYKHRPFPADYLPDPVLKELIFWQHNPDISGLKVPSRYMIFIPQSGHIG